jgi:MSHA biogenesis protein MshN
MSLINDMLRDLSDKQTSREPESNLIMMDVQTASWEQEKIAHFFQHSRLPLILGSLAVFVVLFILLKLVLHNFNYSNFISSISKVEPHSITESHFIDEPYFIESSAKLTSPQEVADDTSQPILNSKIASNLNTIDSSQAQMQIYQLIDQASRAMTLDRLTSPERDNAYFYYQELLRLDSKNALAIAGMTKITDRYLQMAATAIQKNDLTKANFFIDKASMVTPDDIRITDFRKQFLFEDPDSLMASQENSISVNDPFDKKIDSQHQNDGILLNGESLPNVEKQNIENSSLTITPNSEFLDEQTIKQAHDWISQGVKSKALELLESHIQLYPAPASEQYLLDLYYQDQNLTAMQTLLNSSLTMAAVDQTYYRARVSILQNDNQSAITLLESELSQAATNENYRALLAGLYQREQLYTQATSSYRNLLQSFKPKPAYWLGLALSLDAQNQSATAIHAYKKILEFEQIEQQVSEYAQDRIARLSRDY